MDKVQEQDFAAGDGGDNSCTTCGKADQKRHNFCVHCGAYQHCDPYRPIDDDTIEWMRSGMPPGMPPQTAVSPRAASAKTIVVTLPQRDTAIVMGLLIAAILLFGLAILQRPCQITQNVTVNNYASEPKARPAVTEPGPVTITPVPPSPRPTVASPIAKMAVKPVEPTRRPATAPPAPVVKTPVPVEKDAGQDAGVATVPATPATPAATLPPVAETPAPAVTPAPVVNPVDAQAFRQELAAAQAYKEECAVAYRNHPDSTIRYQAFVAAWGEWQALAAQDPQRIEEAKNARLLREQMAANAPLPNAVDSTLEQSEREQRRAAAQARLEQERASRASRMAAYANRPSGGDWQYRAIAGYFSR